MVTAEDRKSELAHTHNALRANGYPEWALAPPPSSAKTPTNTSNNTRRSMLGLPYVAGVSEQLGWIYKSHNIHMYHKPANTLRSMVVHPKDKTPKEHQLIDVEPSITSIHQTESSYHEQRSGIPSACHLHSNYLAEI